MIKNAFSGTKNPIIIGKSVSDISVISDKEYREKYLNLIKSEGYFTNKS